MQAQELENLLKTEIPIAAHLAIHSLHLANDELTLTLPLTPNINHKGTLFGGSLYSGCALACYGLFLSGLQVHSFTTKDIVIAEGNIRYRAPVQEDAKIRAQWNSREEKDHFFQTLKLRKKAKVLMTAQILVDEKICAEFSGYFVAHI